MEQTENHTGMVWYNYGPSIDGVITSGSPVTVELGSDIARQLNQVQIQYGNFSSISNQQPQHIIVAQQPSQVEESTLTVNADNHVEHVQIQHVSARIQKSIKIRGTLGERVPCAQCGKTFSCNANLRDHLRLHTGERPFECSECGMSFAQRSNWRLHKRVHTGEKPYMCGICGKTFSRSSHLPGHMRVHTGERPFNCDNCEQSFTSAQALKNHVRTHTGEKPFICEYCHTPFTHSSSLSSHKKRCNGEKRKRGRPLGSGRRSFKRNNASRSRGRPKKKIKFVKRKSKTNKKDEICELEANAEVELIKENRIERNSQKVVSDIPLKFETNSDMLDIGLSVEIINPSNRRRISDDFISEDVKPNENEGLSILPDRDEQEQKIIITEDMVRAAASAAGLDDSIDLHQEAAVTMATLQHGAINLVHHNICGRNFSDDNTHTIYYKKA